MKATITAALLLAALTGCGKATSGPIDGNWNVTSYLCDQQQEIQSGISSSLSISDTSGSFTVTSGSCTNTTAINLSYSSGTVMLTPNGSPTCSSGCSSCSSYISGTPVFTYSFSGLNTMSLDSYSGTTCEGGAWDLSLTLQ